MATLPLIETAKQSADKPMAIIRMDMKSDICETRVSHNTYDTSIIRASRIINLLNYGRISRDKYKE